MGFPARRHCENLPTACCLLPTCHAGKQIPHERRQSQLVGDHSAKEGEHESHRNGGDQLDVVMFHAAPF
jgi:hypothetical protein